MCAETPFQNLDLTYHQSTLRLINEQSIFSGHAIEVLDHLERERNVVLPASVKEWYALTRGVDILREYSNTVLDYLCQFVN